MIKVVVIVLSRVFILLLAILSTIPLMQNFISYDVYIKGLVKKAANMSIMHNLDNFKISILIVFLIRIFIVDSAEHN
jgi:hypothetical protein